MNHETQQLHISFISESPGYVSCGSARDGKVKCSERMHLGQPAVSSAATLKLDFILPGCRNVLNIIQVFNSLSPWAKYVLEIRIFALRKVIIYTYSVLCNMPVSGSNQLIFL